MSHLIAPSRIAPHAQDLPRAVAVSRTATEKSKSPAPSLVTQKLRRNPPFAGFSILGSRHNVAIHVAIRVLSPPQNGYPDTFVGILSGFPEAGSGRSLHFVVKSVV